ncbi:MAG TPA: universal stress protein [Candidatus Angelobacter sp.]|jgi:nucleotide-binding universal stress UspA family protein|nr:universal stress protein [Candidatus Angelobacter sp.]
MRILLATDGSTYSETAAHAVAEQFRPETSKVMVVEVVEPLYFSAPPEMAPGWTPELAERRRELAELAQKSTDAAADILRRAGFTVETRVVDDEIRNGILETAKLWKADLIVLGSQGKRGIQKFLLGSVAESVARHAPCSVLIARAQEKPAAAKVA